MRLTMQSAKRNARHIILTDFAIHFENFLMNGPNH